MKSKLLIIVAILTLGAGPAFAQSSITLESVTGLYAADSLFTDSQIVFYLRVTNGSIVIRGVTNGFEISSPDGADWGTAAGDTLGTLGKSQFDGGFFISNHIDGPIDTIGFGGFTIFGAGMAVGFDAVAYKITLDGFDTSYHSKQVCLDSSWYHPSGIWKWAAATDVIPSWDGPHCYKIINPLRLDVASRPGDGLPQQWALHQNYPNPFNAGTEISFDVKTRSHVSLTVYNVLGQQVATLVNETMSAGNYVVDWNGTSDAGSTVSSGIYFYRLDTGQYVDTKKMVLLK